MAKARRISLLILAMMLAGCDTHDRRPAASIGGDTPQEVASSLTAMRQQLDAKTEARFTQAVMTLSMVVPDRHDSRSAGNVTPQFAQMVKGRNASEIIQLADLYRGAVPMDKP